MPNVLRTIFLLPLPLLAAAPLGLDTTPLQPETRLAPPSPWHIAAYGLAALLLAGLLLLALRRLRRRAPRPQAPLPPHRQALAALEPLLESPPETPGEQVQWAEQLAGIVRTYLAGRFSLKAPLLTTEEAVEALPRLDTLAPPQRLLLRTLLHSSDLAKFARAPLPREQLLELGAQCREFVQQTAPAEIPQEEKQP